MLCEKYARRRSMSMTRWSVFVQAYIVRYDIQKYTCEINENDEVLTFHFSIETDRGYGAGCLIHCPQDALLLNESQTLKSVSKKGKIMSFALQSEDDGTFKGAFFDFKDSFDKDLNRRIEFVINNKLTPISCDFYQVLPDKANMESVPV